MRQQLTLCPVEDVDTGELVAAAVPLQALIQHLVPDGGLDAPALWPLNPHAPAEAVALWQLHDAVRPPRRRDRCRPPLPVVIDTPRKKSSRPRCPGACCCTRNHQEGRI
ncbi:hypothetical protein GCM10009678_04820 [Actinomadura kijaniata]